MKNLMYVLAIAAMGLVACGAPAEKAAPAEDAAVETETVVETTDTVEMVAEEAEMDSTATEEAAE